jgi:hypothetical protein
MTKVIRKRKERRKDKSEWVLRCKAKEEKASSSKQKRTHITYLLPKSKIQSRCLGAIVQS